MITEKSQPYKAFVSVHEHRSKSQHEIQVAFVDCVRSKLSPKSGRQQTKGLVQSRSQYVHTQSFTNAAFSNENWCKVCQSIDHSTDVCPSKIYSGTTRKRSAERPPPRSSLQACRLFNRYNGECKLGDACIYQHKFDQCRSPSHTRNRCPDPRKTYENRLVLLSQHTIERTLE